MTDVQLTLFAGALLSLAFSYIPGLREWFDGKPATTKRLVMAGALLVVSAVIFGLGCGNLLSGLPLELNVDCSQNGAVNLAFTFVLALIANQATFLISPERKTVEEVVNQ